MGIVWGPRGPMSLGVPENPTEVSIVGIPRRFCDGTESLRPSAQVVPLPLTDGGSRVGGSLVSREVKWVYLEDHPS